MPRNVFSALNEIDVDIPQAEAPLEGMPFKMYRFGLE
jgi:hypothetical protein